MFYHNNRIKDDYCISFLKGIDTCAPILVTEIEEALLANIIASFRFLPSDRATHNPPQNVSPAAARRACNAVRMARNEAAHASDRTAAAQAAIRFNEAVEELEAGYEGTALTTGDLEKYYRMAEDFLSRCGASETIEPQKKAEDEAPRRQKSQKSGSTSRKRQSGGNRAASGRGTSGRSRNTSGRNSRSRQNMQTTARRKKRQRTQSRALTVVLLAVVLLGLLVRAWTMGLMK